VLHIYSPHLKAKLVDYFPHHFCCLLVTPRMITPLEQIFLHTHAIDFKDYLSVLYMSAHVIPLV